MTIAHGDIHATFMRKHCAHMARVGQNHIYIYIYIRCTYGVFGLEISKYTVCIYVYIRFWPTQHMAPASHSNATVSVLAKAVYTNP